ncbi:ribonuclease D [Rubidibacter lacunae KORDI 51-2]|uniref:Ribonuclease D n=1 Tax=Rubidibacter lacunae KORDI 51-2 TaxID=582515 RepID=U5DTH0_9CHRO|nr:ribonuclease H-like domain-containing protein [Rubidibacter lacunae]ERN42980.1 ribonuclease D [Rubidibacter lacunae KORDI 51-2]
MFDSSLFQVCDRDLSEETLQQYLCGDAIAVDTETMGLVPRRDRLCLVQLCDAAGSVTVIRIARGQTSAPNLVHLLTAPEVEKVFHFARFDVAQLQQTFGASIGPIYCTKVASKLARTYTSSHGLKTLVQELESVELDKSSQSSDWGDAANLSDEQLSYAANDVRYLLSLRQKLTQMLQREGRWELAQRCFQCISVHSELDLLQYRDLFDHH